MIFIKNSIRIRLEIIKNNILNEHLYKFSRYLLSIGLNFDSTNNSTNHIELSLDHIIETVSK